MATKKTAGRPKKKESEKVTMMSAYLTGLEKKKVLKKYETLTEAVRQEVLPKCG